MTDPEEFIAVSIERERAAQKKRSMNKLRNALANTVILFLIMVVISAVLAVFVHSVVFLPAWTSIIVGSLGLLFLTMLALEYTPENKDD